MVLHWLILRDFACPSKIISLIPSLTTVNLEAFKRHRHACSAFCPGTLCQTQDVGRRIIDGHRPNRGENISEACIVRSSLSKSYINRRRISPHRANKLSTRIEATFDYISVRTPSQTPSDHVVNPQSQVSAFAFFSRTSRYPSSVHR